MAYLGEAQKSDLIEIASELDLNVEDNITCAELRKLIKNSPDYDIELVKNITKRIIEKRKECEKQNKLEKIENLKIRQLEEVHNREIEVLKLQLESQEKSQEHSSNNAAPKISLMSITSKFDPKNDDILLYLKNFERKAQIAEIPEHQYVAYLMGVLPSDLTNTLAREPADKINDYKYVREILTNQFKLNAEQIRQKFYQLKKETDETWRSYNLQLTEFFDDWLEDLNIKTFEDLKALMIANQIKFRAPQYLKEHFIDKWATWKSPEEMAKCFDEYSNIIATIKPKKEFNKIENKSFENKTKGFNFYQNRSQSNFKRPYYSNYNAGNSNSKYRKISSGDRRGEYLKNSATHSLEQAHHLENVDVCPSSSETIPKTA